MTIDCNSDLYFAYGSNLNAQHLHQWCLREGFPTDLLIAVGAARLPDRELVFDYQSSRWRAGVLDLKTRAGQIVDGIVFAVKPGGWKMLDRKEGAPQAYKRTRTTVLDHDGNELQVQTYEVCPNRRVRFVAPTERYLNVVCKGLESHGLDTGALIRASRNEEQLPAVRALFVYGTLMRGECRHAAIRDAGVQTALLAQSPGTLVDLGGYPGLFRGAPDATEVEGEFIAPDRLDELLPRLDRIEGFRGFGVSGSLYRRTIVDVHVGDGRIREAWTYALVDPSPSAPRIASGCWRTEQGRREATLDAIHAAHIRSSPNVAPRAILAERVRSMSPEAVEPVNAAAQTRQMFLGGELSERMLAKASGNWSAAFG